MGDIHYIEERQPHKVSEVICVKCGKRWVAVRPETTMLKELECSNCGRDYVIETGEELVLDEQLKHI